MLLLNYALNCFFQHYSIIRCHGLDRIITLSALQIIFSILLLFVQCASLLFALFSRVSHASSIVVQLNLGGKIFRYLDVR